MEAFTATEYPFVAHFAVFIHGSFLSLEVTATLVTLQFHYGSHWSALTLEDFRFNLIVVIS